MNTKLSQKEIGERISKLRKIKRLSQEDLSKQIEMSRSSLTQIELGNRNIDIFELQKLAQVLNFSLDNFMSDSFTINQSFIEDNEEALSQNEERVSEPKLNISKFKTVLLYILEKCAGKPNVGETVLYKLLYFSDFNYYELYEEHLTGLQYQKLPFGPVPVDIDSIINQMIDNGEIENLKTTYFGKPQTRFIPLVSADLKQINGAEKDVIDKVIEQMSDWNATMISEYSHKDIPWQITDDGKAINYELAFYREAPFSVRTYNDELQ